jgi:hypothetical protein
LIGWHTRLKASPLSPKGGGTADKVEISISGKVFAHNGPGEICGEMAFLEDSRPSATATAEQEVQAFGIVPKSSSRYSPHKCLATRDLSFFATLFCEKGCFWANTASSNRTLLKCESPKR